MVEYGRAEAVAAGIVSTFLSHDNVARVVFGMEPAKAMKLGMNLGVLYQGVHEEQAEAVVREFLSHEHIAQLLLEMDPEKAAEVGKKLGDLFRGVVKAMSTRAEERRPGCSCEENAG